MWSEPYFDISVGSRRSWARLAAFSWPQDDSSGLRLLNPGEAQPSSTMAWEQRDEVRSKPIVSLSTPDLRVVGFPLSLRKFL